MFGYMPRPLSKNELVKRLVLMQCRVVGKESDETLQRDFAYARRAAAAAVDPELLRIISEMACACMQRCDLERWSQRANPAIYVYNMLTMPLRRAEQLCERVAEMRDNELMHRLCADELRCSVMLTLQLSGIDYSRVFESASSRSTFESVLRQVIATECSHDVQAHHVQLDLWGNAFVDCSITAPEGVRPRQVMSVLRLATVETLTHQFVLHLENEETKFASGEPRVSEISRASHLSSSRVDAICKVCMHSAWLEQNARDWTAKPTEGCKKEMQEDERRVRRFMPLMGFDS